jgi:7,8-dihydropterin-6-yl-methyl-4-(beta-D-ribofuranosyl)aminobenzene 5'-phosphate synthase
MRVKVIATGSGKWERFTGRWGVSFLVGRDLLFDSFGDAKVFSGNMRKFGVDVAKIRHVVLSHDHWDHISGTWGLVSGRRDITVYICPGFGEEVKGRIFSCAAGVVECEAFSAIKEDVFSTGRIRALPPGRDIPEHSLVLKSADGLSVITGCAHPGIVNIVKRVKEHFPGEEVSCVLGGFHLKDNGREENLRIISGLRDLGVRRVAPTHCTGSGATRMMCEVFGAGFMKVSEGDTLEL